MNEGTEKITPEMEKRAALAYSQGFINHAVVGIKKTHEEAGAMLKKANAIYAAYQEKFAKIAAVVREHMKPDAAAPAAK